MSTSDPLRSQLSRMLDWEEAHAGLDAALAGLDPALRGRAPEGLPYSPWQLLEHMRISQRDILDFCRDPAYHAPRWPDDYWPPSPAPPGEAAWEASVGAFQADLAGLKALVADPAVELLAAVPTGTPEQTYLRAALLAADHNAYHVGQLVAVRRLLGDWPPRQP